MFLSYGVGKKNALRSVSWPLSHGNMHCSLMRWLLLESSSSSTILSEQNFFGKSVTIFRVDVLDLTIRLRLPGEALEMIS